MSIPNARYLRKNPTDAENKLWSILRSRRFGNFKFRRQYPIDKYIVDSVCLEKRLVIELDGGQHAERISYDDERSAVLRAKGFEVMRFWNNDVLNNIVSVKQSIWSKLLSPSPVLLPEGTPVRDAAKEVGTPSPLGRGEGMRGKVLG